MLLLGCSGLESRQELASKRELSLQTTIDLGSVGGDISPGSPIVTVPIEVNNFHYEPIIQSCFRAWQVTIRLSPGLKPYPYVGASVKSGPYITDIQPGNDFVFGVKNNDGTYTFFGSFVGDGTVCTYAESGVFATIDLTSNLMGSSLESLDLVPSPDGAVTPSPDIQDAALRFMPVVYGVTHQDIQISMGEIISWTPETK